MTLAFVADATNALLEVGTYAQSEATIIAFALNGAASTLGLCLIKPGAALVSVNECRDVHCDYNPHSLNGKLLRTLGMITMMSRSESRLTNMSRGDNEQR